MCNKKILCFESLQCSDRVFSAFYVAYTGHIWCEVNLFLGVDAQASDCKKERMVELFFLSYYHFMASVVTKQCKNASPKLQNII